MDVNDIYTGNGCSEMITFASSHALNHGDEILVPAPDYPLWTASVSLAGGTPVHYMCDEKSNWFPDLEDMERKITPKTKGIVVINPNNPTGVLYPKEILEGIADIARRHDLVFLRTKYTTALYLTAKSTLHLLPLHRSVCININGLSKSHRMAGFRCGWMCLSGPKQNAKSYIQGVNLLSSMRLCSNVPAQSIIQTALGGIQAPTNCFCPAEDFLNSVKSFTTNFRR